MVMVDLSRIDHVIARHDAAIDLPVYEVVEDVVPDQCCDYFTLDSPSHRRDAFGISEGSGCMELLLPRKTGR
jgi:hypothetical protein